MSARKFLWFTLKRFDISRTIDNVNLRNRRTDGLRESHGSVRVRRPVVSLYIQKIWLFSLISRNYRPYQHRQAEPAFSGGDFVLSAENTHCSVADVLMWWSIQVQYLDMRDMVHELRGSPDTTNQFSWFRRHRQNHFSPLLWPRRDDCNRTVAAQSPAAADHVAPVKTTAAEGIWGLPKFDCARARSWTVAFSVPFFGCTSRQKLAFKYDHHCHYRRQLTL